MHSLGASVFGVIFAAAFVVAVSRVAYISSGFGRRFVCHRSVARTPDALLDRLGGIGIPLSVQFARLPRPLARLTVVNGAVELGASFALLSLVLPTWSIPIPFVITVENTGRGIRLWASQSKKPLIFSCGRSESVLQILQSTGIRVEWERRPNTPWRNVGRRRPRPPTQ
jgi:hypothetical protein